MIAGSIGRRYAKAFLQIARGEGNLEDSLEQLERFGQVLRGSPELGFLMSDPSFEASERKKALSAMAEPLKLSAMTQNFVKLLIDRERIAFFPDILLSFRDQADEDLGRVRVQVRVEDGIGEAKAAQLQKVLEKITKKNVILEVIPQKGLLGGMIVKIKDLVFDGSVKSALTRMKEKMMESAVQ